MKDTTSRTEQQAAQADRLTAAPDWQDERDEPGGSSELGHAHGPGLICLLCAAVKPFRDALAAAGDEHLVCDECLGLYDVNEGCIHSRYLCPQCMDNCKECVWERTKATAAEVAAERWRS